MNATSKKTAPALLTAPAEAEVSEALLRLATDNYADAELIEHQGIVPPVAPEHVTYRRGDLVIESLPWSTGGALVSQRIDVWVPAGTVGKHRAITERSGRGEFVVNSAMGQGHATLGEVTRSMRQARLSDRTTVITGTYSVEVFPHVPLIEGRSEETVREALDNPRRLRGVGKLGPIEGTPEHRHQVIELSITTGGNVRQALQELRGTSTAAGYVAEVGELKSWQDKIGDGSFTTASPSRERIITLAGVRLEWRER